MSNWDDEYREEGLREEHEGDDLSDDPMVQEDVRKSRRLRRRERKARREQQRIARERAAMRADILAELHKEGILDERGILVEINRPMEEGEEKRERVQKKRKRHSRFSVWLMTFLSGNILSRSETRRAYPYLLLIALLAFIYIGNIFRMQQLYRKHDKLTIEVKELRAKSLTIAAQKMDATRQTNILREVERRKLPLHESTTPNKVIPKR